MKTFSMPPAKENSESAVCALCGISACAPFTRFGDAGYVKCSGCGLVYQNPRPPHSDLALRYGSEYFQYELENDENFFKLMLLGLSDIGFGDIAKNISGTKSFIDIGCATGMLLSHMKDRGWETQGVEICTPSAEYGVEKRGVKIFNGTLEEAAFPDESFSVVHCSHLIEHLADPAGFIREAGRVLKADGRFIITTPNISGLQAVIFKERWRSAIPDHVYLFSLKTLREMLLRNGFLPLKHKTWGGLAAGSVPRPLKTAADRMAKFFGFGDVMIIVSKKGDLQEDPLL